MVDNLLEEFDLEKVAPSMIMVAGIGGAGGNAINHMFDLGIKDVSFMVCNTDKQALNASPVPIKVQLGEGLGAGNNPEKGRSAAIESLDKITDILNREGTKMIFITAGMGGGTGTGAAPIIAKAAKEMGILTVGIVTMPYKTEGPFRAKNAIAGIEELKKSVDSLLIINNENIQEIFGKLPITEAFGRANDVLATAAKGIAEIITRPGIVNVDFADVCTVMRNSGIALMGSGRASGEERALRSAETALLSPLLNHNSIIGAKNILINITYGDDEVTLDESSVIRDYIQNMAGEDANIIWGAGGNEMLGDDIEVTLIATGFTAAVDGLQPNFPSIPVMPINGAGGSKTRWQQGGGDMGNPFARPTQPINENIVKAQVRKNSENVIQFNDDRKRYANIEKLTNEPAYIRRKVRINQDGASDDAKRAVKNRFAEVDGQTQPSKSKVEEGSSLFD